MAWLRDLARRPALLIPCAVLLLAVASGAVWLLTRPTAPAAAEQAPPLTADQAKTLAADATSGDPARVRQAMAIPDAQTLNPSAPAALAKLTLTIDPATFAANGPRTGTVSGTVTSGGVTTPAVFVVVYSGGGWHLVDTVRAG